MYIESIRYIWNLSHKIESKWKNVDFKSSIPEKIQQKMMFIMHHKSFWAEQVLQWIIKRKK